MGAIHSEFLAGIIPSTAMEKDLSSYKFIVALGGLVGTQRKKAEHALYKSHMERHTSSTKRLHTTSAKSGNEDHTTLFRASDSVASSQAVRPKIDEKLVGNRRKSTPDRAKIDEKSILSRPGRPKSLVWDAARRVRDGFWTSK